MTSIANMAAIGCLSDLRRFEKKPFSGGKEEKKEMHVVPDNFEMYFSRSKNKF